MPPIRVSRRAACCVLPAALGLLLSAPVAGADRKADKVMEISGTSEFLRSVPKHFATLKAVDPARGQVTLLLGGDKTAKEWSVVPDAEVKIAGWWGRLDQFQPGDRVWVWFKTNR